MHTGIKLLTLSGLLLSSVTSQALTLSSDSVTNNQSFKKQQIFNQWGCTGDNMSPQLSWSDVPKGTKIFALTMYDPDAPTGSGWWHWVVVNLPANSHSLAAGAGALGKSYLPKGASMVTNDFGFKGYGGACPPPNSKPHQYHITLYALNTDKIKLPDNATAALAGALAACSSQSPAPQTDSNPAQQQPQITYHDMYDYGVNMGCKAAMQKVGTPESDWVNAPQA